jgi:hypothetical protein
MGVLMSSYFDEKSRRVGELECSQEEDFIASVAEIEQQLIQDVVLVAGDRQFPQDLREKIMCLIAEWHVGHYAELEPRPEAVKFVACMRMSELVERMHGLFHEVARRRIVTRFGLLNDHPRSIIDRRDEHDAAKYNRAHDKENVPST